MSHGFIGFAAFLFIGLTAINRILEGVMINASEMTILNQLTVFRSFNVAGLFNMPIPNLDFVTIALPRLFTWDYSFFGGNACIIQYMLYSITAAASFGLFVLLISAAVNFLVRR